MTRLISIFVLLSSLPTYLFSQSFVAEIPALAAQTPETRYYTMEKMFNITYQGILHSKLKLSYSASNLANLMTGHDEETHTSYRSKTPGYTRKANNDYDVLMAIDSEHQVYISSSPFPESVAGDHIEYLPTAYMVPSLTQMKLDKRYFDGASGVLRMTDKAYSASVSMLQNN